MSKRDALKLHNGDEVTLKDTGEVITVITAYEGGCSGDVIIEALSPEEGYIKVGHLGVK